MLGRLFKYELKATARILIPIYIAFIAISGISRVSLEFQTDENSPLYFISDIALIIFMSSAITIFVATAIVIVWRFYRNTSSDEGYLLFTLPVRTDYMIISEFLCAFIWCIIMSVFIIGGIFLMILDRNIDGITIGFSYIPKFFSSLSSDGIKAIFISFLYMIVSILAEIMAIYCAISLASLLKNHRLMFSVLFYIGLITITNAIDALLMKLMGCYYISDETDISNTFFDEFSLASIWNNMIAPAIISNQMIVDFIFLISIIIIEYFIVRKILSKHLNIC